MIQLNQQIKELYDQSLDRINKTDANGNPMIVIQQNPEKFAEAIIRRCGQIAWRHTPDTEELLYGHLICDKITEYFGIDT